MNNLHRLTIHESHALLKEKKISSVELTRAVLKHLEPIDSKIHACMRITSEQAMASAAAADRAIAEGNCNPLTGVPAIIKDNMCTRGITTTCSSKMLEHFVPPYDAHVIEKLNSVNAVMVGKANMDEFAMGSSTENSAFFTTRNPWKPDCVPGGSSGGSAAAVSADACIYALGSDTGGSIRQPAGFCGVVGLKPTYGRVSRYGLVAFASSLDQIGPLAKDVTDAALIMNVIAGHDRRDSTTVPLEVPDYSRALKSNIKGLRVGVPREYLVEGMQPAVRKSIDDAVKKLEELGAKVDWDVSLPNTRFGLAAYYILAPSEASANLARYDGVKYGYSYRETTSMWESMERTKQHGFGAEVKRRIMLGTYALSAGYYDAYYLKAQKVRTLIKRDFDRAFEKYDVLVTPTSPTVAFKIGEKADDPVQMYLSDVCTLPINIAGVPAISIPAGFVDGLPVGLQFIGKHFSEETLLRTAYTFEQATPWHNQKPAIM
ncbi:MAG: Asp-tRNA(Asn)/Glu-tRNA(Gln) amidotransferase subunit GatA [Dehalococcoidia bacterium]|nr:Asp-tRNA(Asn)/Glu-tRNA(Gln) amidotransferase subunit GatA [Dehalococcoidia bacterium]